MPPGDYRPESQDWFPSPHWLGIPEGRHWVGWDRANPPTPEELQIDEDNEGAEVLLGDGNMWHIAPDEKPLTPEDAAAMVDQNSNDLSFVFAYQCLFVNYDIVPALAIGLNLFTPESLREIAIAAGAEPVPSYNEEEQQEFEAAYADTPDDRGLPVVEAAAMSGQPEDENSPWWYEFGSELGNALFEILEPEITLDDGTELMIAFSSNSSREMHPETGAAACLAMGQFLFGDDHPDGPVIWINDSLFFEYENEPIGQGIVQSMMIGQSCHEFGHILTIGDRTFETTLPQSELEQIASDSMLPGATMGRISGPAWRGHDLNWIRATLHIAYRLEQLGYSVDYSQGFNFADYGYSGELVYMKLLSDEFRSLEEMPIREVLGTRAPDGFIHQWASDVGTKQPHGRVVEISASSVSISRESKFTRAEFNEVRAFIRQLKASRAKAASQQ